MAKDKFTARGKGHLAVGLAVMSAIAGAVVAAAATIGTLAGKHYWHHLQKTASKND